MATILYGNEWVGDDTPTTGVLAGQSWVAPTTGAVYRRNTSNSAWILSGNINENLGGSVSKAGDTMTGSLLGAPNLPPIQDPDFQGTVEQAGFPLATLLALSQLQQNLKSYIDESVRAQFLSQTKLSGTAANVAFFSDVYTYSSGSANPGTISVPLPTFSSDSVQATRAQTIAYGVSLMGILGGATMWTTLAETFAGSMIFKLSWAAIGLSGTFTLSRWSFAVR